MNRRQLVHAGITLSTLSAVGGISRAQTRAAEPEFWKLAPTPPMGWNSYDYYGSTVTEAEFLADAEAQQRLLLPFGYEYTVIDFLWFDPMQATPAVARRGPLAMDRFGRLLPALNKFPSAHNGRGFKPLADRIAAMGLKFGIHIMRGIPRQAVAANTPIQGTNFTARQAANVHSVCAWNDDMYGVRGDTPAGLAYFNSLIQLYASWGVTFIKCDDLSYPYHKAEIHALRRALDRFGPHIVLSTSPGPTPVSEGSDISHCANMWRIRNDCWDSWRIIDNMIDLVAGWKGFVGPGHWADCDMLPLGRIGKDCVGGRRMTELTMDEQRTVMTLWGIAPSPLFMGGKLPGMDPWTRSLLTNVEMLAINQDHLGAQGTRISRHGPLECWAKPLAGGDMAVALFNRGPANGRWVEAKFAQIGFSPRAIVRDVWNSRTLGEFRHQIHLPVSSHGARLLRLSPA